LFFGRAYSPFHFGIAIAAVNMQNSGARCSLHGVGCANPNLS
jgi:hypothetical protein